MRKLSNAVLAVILVSALTLTMTFSAVAADSVNETAEFTISNSYDISVYNETTLEFPGDLEVGDVGSTGQFETTELEVYLEHNYDVQVTAEGSAFDLDNTTSDYSSDYAIAAEWFFETAVGSYSSGEGNWSTEVSKSVSSYDTTITETFDVEIDSTEGDAYGRISVKATRNGLDDPQGTYTASLDIKVSDLN